VPIDDFIRVSVKDLQSMAFTTKELRTIVSIIDFYIQISSATKPLTDDEKYKLDYLKEKCVKLLIKGVPDGNAT